MHKIIKISTLLLVTFTFGACSNMQMGFDEESVFYQKPTQPVLAEKKTVSKSDKRVIEIPKEEKMQEELENETTLSYDPQAGYE